MARFLIILSGLLMVFPVTCPHDKLKKNIVD